MARVPFDKVKDFSLVKSTRLLKAAAIKLSAITMTNIINTPTVENSSVSNLFSFMAFIPFQVAGSAGAEVADDHSIKKQGERDQRAEINQVPRIQHALLESDEVGQGAEPSDNSDRLVGQ